MSFGDKQILSNVCVKVDNLVRMDDGINGQATGQVVAFLGPSGVGKTQLLRILAGLQRPTSGSVFIGKDRTPVRPGLVGLVSQNYLLYPNRTVTGNLRVAAMRKNKDVPIGLKGIARFPIIKNFASFYGRWVKSSDEAKMMLERFDLSQRATMYPAQLSGGQRQRVAIAQQLLCSEHFLLMDEPTAGLDPIAKKKVCAQIVEVANQDDLNTIIVVTHDIRSALAFADTVWLMGRDRDAQGNIISGAKIKKVYDLIERGLTWHVDVMNTPEFVQTEQEIIREFDTL